MIYMFYFTLSPTQERICLGLCCVVGKESVVPNPEQCIIDYCQVRPMYMYVFFYDNLALKNAWIH